MNDIHDLIQAEYEKDNYKIEYNSCKNGLAYIYCSSNALYEKDNLQSFEDKIIKEDRYEWSNLRADCKPEIEIFIRDIWLSWYVKGINSRINTYDKLIDFINDTWYGMTYHEDVAAVKDSFKKMLKNGVYKADLFADL